MKLNTLNCEDGKSRLLNELKKLALGEFNWLRNRTAREWIEFVFHGEGGEGIQEMIEWDSKNCFRLVLNVKVLLLLSLPGPLSKKIRPC